MAGRFAPSPTGELHVGNLRTALCAWLLARSEGRGFLVRMEDLDRVNSSVDHERAQLADLAALGIHHDGDVVRQSDRFDLYRDAVAELDAAGLVYPCWCSRRDIARDIEAAAAAPHGASPVGGAEVDVAPGAYPGTCRDLSAAQRAERERSGRAPALRLRADRTLVEVRDRVWGDRRGVVDDVVLQRGDGVPAYNLAVVIDDHLQGVTQVVRGDDLLSSTPRQVYLQQLLGLATPEYVHVPLVLGHDGERLAKRHGAVTLADLAAAGRPPAEVLALLAASLGLDVSLPPSTAADLLDPRRPLDPAQLPRAPVMLEQLLDLRRSGS